jgi:hypothetical protein
MKTQGINSNVDLGRPMTDKVLSTKVTDEEVDIIKSIAEEKGTTVSALLRTFIEAQIAKRNVDWDAPCFGTNPRDDKPKKQKVTVDDVVYGK